MPVLILGRKSRILVQLVIQVSVSTGSCIGVRQIYPTTVFFHNVVSLDLRDEKCGIMATPQHLWPFNVCYVSYPPLVEDLGGYLSLIIYTTTLEINVWVMMKYGDAESWTKIVRVGVQVQCHCG